MKTLLHFLHSQTIRNKVLVFGVAMSTIPLLLISFYYYSYVKSDLEDRILEKQNLMLQNLSREIEFDFNQFIICILCIVFLFVCSIKKDC